MRTADDIAAIEREQQRLIAACVPTYRVGQIAPVRATPMVLVMTTVARVPRRNGPRPDEWYKDVPWRVTEADQARWAARDHETLQRTG